MAVPQSAERKATHLFRTKQPRSKRLSKKRGGRVHLVGHSYGGLVALAVALRNRVKLASLTIFEAPAVQILQGRDQANYPRFRGMTDRYFAAFQRGRVDAIEEMINFYGGHGTFASWPSRVRDYAMETTPVNILDWSSAYGFPLSASALAAVKIPVVIVWGSQSQPAVQRANELLAQFMKGATSFAISDASHFMIVTHSKVVAAHVEDHALCAEHARAAVK